jgi:hypothetical protein
MSSGGALKLAFTGLFLLDVIFGQIQKQIQLHSMRKEEILYL